MLGEVNLSVEELYSTIPLLPELELISSSLAVGDDFSMEGLRRAMLASDTLDDPNGLTSLHDSSAMDYDTDASELYKLTQMKLQSSSDPILHDRRLQDDDDDDEHDDGHVMYTELTTSGFRHCSPGSEGESSFDQDLSDCSSSDSALDSPSSAMKWETIAECHVTPMSGDTDGPLPPVTDIFSSRMGKDDFLDLSTHRSLPCLIKTEVESEDEVMDNSMPPLLQIVPTALAHNVYSTLPVSVPSPTIPISSTTPDDVTTTATAAATTTNNSNHHDYTTTQGVDENNNERRVESSRRGTHSRVATHENGEKCQRKKPGRKKGQVSKVLHLWEFIRDLLSDPQYCPRIINWENEREGVFRVMQSSEVARLWGEKKKNKKTMTYEKLSRSLRYSRKEGYFDALPKDMGYPKKLCFKFGPKSHGWRDFALKP